MRVAVPLLRYGHALNERRALTRHYELLLLLGVTLLHLGQREM